MLILFYFCFLIVFVEPLTAVGTGASGNDGGLVLASGGLDNDEFSGFAAMSPRRKQAFFLSMDDEKLERFKQRFYRIVDNSLINEGSIMIKL